MEKESSYTLEKMDAHPLSKETMVEIVFKAWNDIESLQLGTESYEIGKDLFPKPQLIGMLLHELISLEIGKLLPDQWKGDDKKEDKDLVYIPDNDYSIEIKTSSTQSGVFGNRSYVLSEKGKKLKSSYYLIVNFKNFSPSQKGYVRSIRFGYLDREDWIAQTAESGQQCRLSKDARENKLTTIYRAE